MSEELPEWYTVIKNCLREFERFDMKAFVSSGGYEAAVMLETKLQHHKTLLKLADIRERNAAQQTVAADKCPSCAGSGTVEITDTIGHICTDCEGSGIRR